MKTRILTLLAALSLTAGPALAQDPAKPAAEPAKPAPTPDEKKAPGISSLAKENAKEAAQPAPAQATPAQPRPSVAPPVAPPRGPRGGFGGPRGMRGGAPDEPANITLNFENESIKAVLTYLSESAGFSIVYDADVNGEVSVVSLQPMTKTQVVELLNTVLYKKGYAAVREDETLVVYNVNDVKYKNIPVISDNIPENIPMSDKVVTQIIPVRYANAQELTTILEGLLPESATMSASQTSNALIITDSQKNIRRMAEIVRALDTTISDISTIKVYPLTNASATDAAEIITQLFSGGGTSGRTGGTSRFGGGGSPFGGRTGGMPGGRFGGGRGGR